MGQAHFARPWHQSAAGEPGIGDRVMRRPERTLAHGPCPLEEPGRAIDPGDVDHLVEGHDREYRRESPGQHSLASARRTDKEDVMSSRRGHFKSPLDVLLAFHLLKIDVVDRGRKEVLRRDQGRPNGRRSVQEFDDLDEIVQGKDVEVRHENGLPLVGLGHDDAAEALFLDEEGDRQDPRDRL